MMRWVKPAFESALMNCSLSIAWMSSSKYVLPTAITHLLPDTSNCFLSTIMGLFIKLITYSIKSLKDHGSILFKLVIGEWHKQFLYLCQRRLIQIPSFQSLLANVGQMHYFVWLFHIVTEDNKAAIELVKQYLDALKLVEQWSVMLSTDYLIRHAYYYVAPGTLQLWVLVEKLLHSLLNSLVKVRFRALIHVNSDDLILELDIVLLLLHQREESPAILRVGNQTNSISILETSIKDIV